MDVSKATYEKLVDMINMFVNHGTFELEGKYKGDISKDAFTRCLQHCKAQKLDESVYEHMDVMVRYNNDSYRITLDGKNVIASVFKTNMLPSSLDGVGFMRKTPIKGVYPLLLSDISFRVDLKDEQVIDESLKGELALKFPSLDKGFRFKRRFSYKDDVNALRYDFTLIKSSITLGSDFICHKNMAQSQVLNAKDSYEVEVEVMREGEHDKRKHTKSVIAKRFLASLVNLFMVIQNEKHFISNEQKNEVLKSYLKMCYIRGEGDTISSLMKKCAIQA